MLGRRPRRVGPRLSHILLVFTAFSLARPASAESVAPPVDGTPESDQPRELPPVDVAGLRGGAPSPQWDVGLMAGAAGIGKSDAFESVDFAGALIFDVHWLRRRQENVGLGFYGQVGTTGFFDTRVSLGPSLHVPTGDLFSLRARVGALLLADGQGASAGGEAYLEWGLANLNPTGHYALTHLLVTGIQVTPADAARTNAAIWLALRVDAFWPAAPFGMLF